MGKLFLASLLMSYETLCTFNIDLISFRGLIQYPVDQYIPGIIYQSKFIP